VKKLTTYLERYLTGPFKCRPIKYGLGNENKKKKKQQSKAADMEYQNLFLCLIRKKELSNKN
jgi:hypothetical protein